MNQDKLNLVCKISLWFMALVYVGAGINHFWHVEFYRPLMPPWIPAHELMVSLSGVIEVVLGVALLFQRTRRFAAYSIILMLIVFLNVHVYMWMERDGAFSSIPTWILFARLPMQVVLIAWAWFCARTRGSAFK